MKGPLHAIALSTALMTACQTVDCEGDGPPVDWDQPPLLAGVEVDSAGKAAEKLRFPPVFAESLGSPMHIFVDQRRNRLSKNLAIVYETPTYGRFNVMERTSPMSQADLQSVVDAFQAGTGCGEAKMVAITEGVRGAQITGHEANSVVWLQGHIRFSVLGPAETFAPDESIAVAREVIAASTPG